MNIFNISGRFLRNCITLNRIKSYAVAQEPTPDIAWPIP